MLNPTFEAVPEPYVCRLLENDELQIQEVDAFSAVVRWGKARYGDIDPNVLREKLANIMQYVRFPMMDSKDMADSVEPLNLVDQSLLLEAYRFKATGGDLRNTRGDASRGNRRFIPRRAISDQAPYANSSSRYPMAQIPFQSRPTLSAQPTPTPISQPPSQMQSQSQMQTQTPMVGVGLGLSLHSSLPCMLVTEVAPWCQIQSGDLQKIEVGDMLKSIDGWPVNRSVDAVKKHLLGPPNTLVTLGILRRGVDYEVVVVRGSSDRMSSRFPVLSQLLNF